VRLLLLFLAVGLIGVGHAAATPTQVRVAVVKLTWGPQPYSDGDVDTSMQAVAGFYTTASFGKVAVSYTQTPWVAGLSGPSPCSSLADIEALVSRAAGYTSAPYDRLVVLLPQPACPGLVGITEPDGIVAHTVDPGVIATRAGSRTSWATASEWGTRPRSSAGTRRAAPAGWAATPGTS
jgi:hypothetical protein